GAVDGERGCGGLGGARWRAGGEPRLRLRHLSPSVRVLLRSAGTGAISERVGFRTRTREEGSMAEERKSGHAIDTLLLEERRYPPPEDFARDANARPNVYELSLEEFWRKEAENRVTWVKPFDTLLEWKLPYAKWFIGGT